MANKLVTVFLMCCVVAAALNIHTVVAATDEKFKACFNTCESECKADGNGSTFCEMKCDGDCTAKEVADKLNIKLP
ncbi:major pollen allergen Ole e 6-like [Syzygium oleosum]|uniref:major pollen allergen Ole e 6-like n=1 Tax=Syzygium oleosum TaxID=219896 RepID=UPI0024B9C7D8|nr:major pollen allergen Ole e 6-like [Syzygium oleosum]